MSPTPEALEAHRGRLSALARRNLSPILLRRVSPEDVVQETLASACAHPDFLANRPDIPLYLKLRTLLFQTLANLQRRHLQSAKRDAYKEVSLEDGPNTEAQSTWERFAAAVTGPVTHAARQDRRALLRRTLAALPEHDRQILELRHFDGLSNLDCAEALGLSPKAASLRYVRALQRLQRLLLELTEFRP